MMINHHCVAGGVIDQRHGGDSHVIVTGVQEYQAKFNPFAEFQQNEEARGLKSLPVHDRAILTGSR